MRGFPIFTFLFLVVPIIEIYLLIEVGSVIGVFPTMFLVVATAVIGAYLLRQQGLSTLSRFQSNMANGVMPAREMIEGVILLVGGAFLMTPGFFTDAMGFMCLLPFTRRYFVEQLIKRSTVSMMGGVSVFRSRTVDEEIIEGEFQQKPDQHIGKDR
ncbi:MAG: exlusion protein FxsA [Proteobacteria bacterium]|nr:MAG: exlusion protein FxsA [Pseudomonadota bacterium]